MVRLLNGVSRLLLLRLLPPLLLFCQQAEWAQAADPESRRESLEEVEVSVRRISVQPAVFLVENFLEAAHCDSLAASALPALKAEPVEAGDQRSSTLFGRAEMEDVPLLGIVARRLRNMVRELIGDQNKQDGKAFLKLYPVETDYAEVLEAVQFGVGGYRRLHNEAFHRDRVLTTLVFLHDTPAGGEVVFPALSWDADMKQYVPSRYFREQEKCQARDSEQCTDANNRTAAPLAGMDYCCCSELLRIKPRKGDAVIYLTVDAEGEPAHPAVHASCPVLSTTSSEADYKLVLRQWIHAQPLGESSRRALNPDAGEPTVENDGDGVKYIKRDAGGSATTVRGGAGAADKPSSSSTVTTAKRPRRGKRGRRKPARPNQPAKEEL